MEKDETVVEIDVAYISPKIYTLKRKGPIMNFNLPTKSNTKKHANTNNPQQHDTN